MVEKIIKISPDDMPAKLNRHLDYDAVRALEEGEAIKFPCRWAHNGIQSCRSSFNLRFLFRKNQWAGRWICKDGWVYVHRLNYQDPPPIVHVRETGVIGQWEGSKGKKEER